MKKVSKRALVLTLFAMLSGLAVAQRTGGRFEQLDTNRDGVLQATEVTNQQTFRYLDANSDGQLTRGEALKGLADARSRRESTSQPGQGRTRMGMTAPAPARKAEGMKVVRDLAYAPASEAGQSRLLSMDVYSPAKTGSWPVIVMVHGGGWKRGDKASPGVATAKSHYFVQNGFVFISVNYRLVPDVKPTDQAGDLARAVGFLKKEVNKYGGDPDRIVLMGHSAGAHLSARVATDPTYLRTQGLSPKDLQGVVLLDGAAYNLPEALGEGGTGKMESGLYRDAFGHDTEFWRKCSPTLQAGAAPLPPFLIFHAGQREAARHFSQQLAEALLAAGGKAEVVAVPDKNHAGINKDIGTSDDGIGERILEFTAGL
jgi:acetyl esterase/lipase